jgi:hypothetical protein
MYLQVICQASGYTIAVVENSFLVWLERFILLMTELC